MWKCLLGLPYLIVKLWKSGESDCKSKMRKNKYIKKERKKETKRKEYYAQKNEKTSKYSSLYYFIIKIIMSNNISLYLQI